MRRFKPWIVLAVVAVVGFLLDWWTKAVVLDAFEAGADARPVLGDVLQWQLVFNRGALFSLNPDNWIPGFPTRYFYMAFSAVAMVFLVWFYGRLDPVQHRLSRWGLAVVLPGAMGNFLDRALARPGVVDFIRVDLGFAPFHPWPTFNVADIWITVGVGLLVLDMIRTEIRERAARNAGAAASTAPAKGARGRKKRAR